MLTDTHSQTHTDTRSQARTLTHTRSPPPRAAGSSRGTAGVRHPRVGARTGVRGRSGLAWPRGGSSRCQTSWEEPIWAEISRPSALTPQSHSEPTHLASVSHRCPPSPGCWTVGGDGRVRSPARLRGPCAGAAPAPQEQSSGVSRPPHARGSGPQRASRCPGLQALEGSDAPPPRPLRPQPDATPQASLRGTPALLQTLLAGAATVLAPASSGQLPAPSQALVHKL